MTDPLDYARAVLMQRFAFTYAQVAEFTPPQLRLLLIAPPTEL